MTRLATIVGPLGHLVELLDTARYSLDRFHTLPDGLRRIERVIEAALPMVHTLADAAGDDAEQQVYEELFDIDRTDEGAL